MRRRFYNAPIIEPGTRQKLTEQPAKPNSDICYFKDLKQGDAFEFLTPQKRPPYGLLLHLPDDSTGVFIKTDHDAFMRDWRKSTNREKDSRIYDALHTEQVKKWQP